MSRGFFRKACPAIAGIFTLLAWPAVAQERVELPPPYESWSASEVAARAFGLLAGQREAWLVDAKIWRYGNQDLLAVIAEAERPNVDGSFCDCARPTRLALIEGDVGELHTVAATLIPEVRGEAAISLNSPLLTESLVEGGVFRLNADEPLLPVVRSWSEANRRRAELALYRLGNWRLMPVFTRLILDDPTGANPNLSGMRARMKIGNLDPGGVAGFTDIRFVERYFTRFGDDIIDLDDRRVEVWVFGGDRYSLVQCELYGPMGFGACVQ